MLGIGGGLFGFAGLFYFAAEYEHMSGWKWALASAAVTATVKGLFPGSFIFVLPAQFGLFLVMWWAHVKNKAQREVERDQRQKDAVRERQQRRSARSASGWPENSASARSARWGREPEPSSDPSLAQGPGRRHTEPNP